MHICTYHMAELVAVVAIKHQTISSYIANALR